MNAIIAIIGMPAVGKSTVARLLGEALGAPVRHCGSIVKLRSEELGFNTDQLPLDIHREIDADTTHLALTTQSRMIIEGRFLDIVLSQCPNVLCVSLECNLRNRLKRHSGRGRTVTSRSLEEEDTTREQICRSLYGTTQSVIKHIEKIDTTEMTSVQASEEILRLYHDYEQNAV